MEGLDPMLCHVSFRIVSRYAFNYLKKCIHKKCVSVNCTNEKNLHYIIIRNIIIIIIETHSQSPLRTILYTIVYND